MCGYQIHTCSIRVVTREFLAIEHKTLDRITIEGGGNSDGKHVVTSNRAHKLIQLGDITGKIFCYHFNEVSLIITPSVPNIHIIQIMDKYIFHPLLLNPRNEHIHQIMNPKCASQCDYKHAFRKCDNHHSVISGYVKMYIPITMIGEDIVKYQVFTWL